MAIKIIVLSDGTWETVGDAEIITITEDAYERLCEGDEVKDLDDDQILESQVLEEA